MAWLVAQGQRYPLELAVTSTKGLPCTMCTAGNMVNDAACCTKRVPLEVTLVKGGHIYVGSVGPPHSINCR